MAHYVQLAQIYDVIQYPPGAEQDVLTWYANLPNGENSTFDPATKFLISPNHGRLIIKGPPGGYDFTGGSTDTYLLRAGLIPGLPGYDLSIEYTTLTDWHTRYRTATTEEDPYT